MKSPYVIGTILALACVLQPGPAAARQPVTGTVSDAATGSALPAATVQVEGTYSGTIANAEGRFQLVVSAYPVRLVVRYIGYATATITVEGPTDLVVRLEPAPVTMPEVVVSGEDPAVAIMRRVIERKRIWRDRLERFRADAFARMTLENDTGIVTISESFSSFWWDRDKGSREVLLGSRRSANLPGTSRMPAGLSTENLYDDDVELAGTRLMGVTHPKALDVYDVSLAGTRRLDGALVFDIDVVPRSDLASAFLGRVSVLDEAFILLEADLRPGPSFLFPPPIRYLGIRMTQQFRMFPEGFVLPVDFRADYEVDVGFSGLLEFPTIRVRQVARLDGYEIGAEMPDSLADGTARFIADRPTTRGDSLVAAGTLVPLSEREATALAGIDSTDTLDEAFRPRGALARFVRISTDGGQGDARRPRRFTPAAEAWVDRVAGVHVALGGVLKVAPRGRLFGRAGYDGSPGTTNWGLGGSWTVVGSPPGLGFRGNRRPSDPGWSLVASFARGVEPRFASRTQDAFFNTLRVVFNGHDYFDYLRRDRMEAGVHWAMRGRLRPSITLAWRHDRDRSIAAGSPVRFTGSATPRANPAIPEGTLDAAVLTARLGTRPDDFGFGGASGGELEMEAAPAGLGAAAEGFVRFSGRVDLRFVTAYARRLIPNTLDLAFTAGKALGPVPPQRWGVVDGTGGWSSFGALRTLEDAFYEGDAHVFAAWEHHFRTVPFEAIGLRGLARRGYGLILAGAHGRTWLSGRSRGLAKHVPTVSPGWHHELGISVSGVGGVLRIDVTRRLDAVGWRVGVGTARLF